MQNPNKYIRQFFPVKNPTRKWAEKTYIEKAPIWCSVDLRDGNQALTIPMSLEDKLAYFELLVSMGFKEIEVGFPAASETEYRFLRTLIERELIPNDVTIQVMTQSREHIIQRTFEALEGCQKAIVHLYNSTSFAQREQVFQKSKEEIIALATEGARQVLEMSKNSNTDCRFEYSPESFTGTEPEFALEICNAVLSVWEPTLEKKAIINLPVTMELSSPHIYADQVEYICNHLINRDSVVVSLHPHNDRGCAVADAELGLLAGADRVEGTLFGNGERTGNVDLITLALNLYTQGIDPKLDLSDMPKITSLYEDLTRMTVYERQPYAGELVFAAFSGSHQDAIAKGMKWQEKTESKTWSVPYLPMDPRDIGREYETQIIRINSQSGGGGIAYLLETSFGYTLPKRMRAEVAKCIKELSDEAHAELSGQQVLKAFTENYVNRKKPIQLIDYHFSRENGILVKMMVAKDGIARKITATGNGRLDAVSNAIKKELGIPFSDLTYEEHAITQGSASQAISYVSITTKDGQKHWGVGIHDDIIASSVNALFSAVNRSLSPLHESISPVDPL